VTIRPKFVYLAKRHPRLTREQFISRWREHGALAMGFMARQHWENVTRYVHCDAIHDHGLSGVSDDYDGVGLIWFKDLDARKRHRSFAEARAAREADEDLAFAARVDRAALLTDEQVVLEGPTAGVKVVRFIARDRGAGDESREVAWREEQRTTVLGGLDGAMRRYVQNVPLPPENGVASSLDCRAVEEMWFDDVDALSRAWPKVMSANTGATAAAIVIVREVFLYPPPR
jgi:hypothetical protein